MDKEIQQGHFTHSIMYGRTYSLTLDVEGGVGGCGHVPRGQTCGHTLEVAHVIMAIHCSKFEVSGFHESSL